MAKEFKSARKVDATQQQAPKAAAPERRAAREEQSYVFHELLFDNKNYLIMGGGIGLIVLGFLLMSGGRMPDANTWDESAIYSFRRITLAPFVVILGLCTVVYGIFKK